MAPYELNQFISKCNDVRLKTQKIKYLCFILDYFVFHRVFHLLLSFIGIL
jgi:hypothetical protein